MRITLRAILRLQNADTRVQFAHNEERCHQNSIKLRQVSKICSNSVSSSSDANKHEQPWLFTVQGIDLIEALPVRKRNVKYVVVTLDYFTKWNEVKILAVITSKIIQNFVWKAIVCQFGILYKHSSHNGMQFELQAISQQPSQDNKKKKC